MPNPGVRTAVIETEQDSGVRAFLNKGGFWRVLLVTAIYFAIYLPAGKLASNLADRSFSEADTLTSIGTIFVQLTVALIVGSIVLIAFTTFMGWNAELFGRQPIYRSAWMWIAPVVILTPIVLRMLGIDWGGRALSVSMMMMATGLLIGFSEELLFRGVAVKLLRSSGYREWSVAAISSLLFALFHSLNIFSGGSLRTVSTTVLYTFAFGILMYLSMRVIGFIAGAMILHALTDPTTFLATGGLPDAVDATTVTGLADIGGKFTIVVILAGWIMALFIRGKVGDLRGAKPAAS